MTFFLHRMRGTWLNFATVIVGSLVGLALGKALPEQYMSVTLSGLGLVTLALGVKMFLAGNHISVIALAIAAGGMLGVKLGITPGLESLGDLLKANLPFSSGSFTEGFVTATVLFCVGPMTLLGCIDDGLTGKSELLRVKSILDGFAAIFLASTLGAGVLVSAFAVLIFQGVISALANQLKGLKENDSLLAEFTGTGGVLMIAIGLGLLKIVKLSAGDYLPALALIPLYFYLADKRKKRSSESVPS